MLLLHKTLEDFMLPCASKKYLGIDCIGCGLQRSVALILRGKFIDAFYMYPAIYPIIFLLGFLIFNFFVKTKYAEKIKLSLAALSIITALINYILKFY